MESGKSWCTWKPDSEGTYWTTCNNGFVFTTDGPKEHEFKYCPYCGEIIVEQLSAGDE